MPYLTQFSGFTCKALALFILITSLLGCGQPEEIDYQAQAIHDEDECAVCGMLITRFPGPKGQAIFDHEHVKFCSTRDMVAFITDEENSHRIKDVFVHDMEKTTWKAPTNTHYIDGRSAWYVTGSDQKGAMGPTFASFSNKQAAQNFAKEHGGELQTFSELKPLQNPMKMKM